MSEYLSPLALSLFPKQVVTGHIPYKHVRDYILQGEDFPVVYYGLVYSINFKSLKVVNTPQELDNLFLYIQTCVEKNEFPKGIGKKTQLWFKEIFPYCNRHVYSSVVNGEISLSTRTSFDPKDFALELSFLKFKAFNPPPSGKPKSSEDDQLFEVMSPEQRIYFFKPVSGSAPRMPFVNWKYDEFTLNAPHIYDHILMADRSSLTIPSDNHWRSFALAMQKSSTTEAVEFTEIRDFCYRANQMLTNPETPELQRLYLKDWLSNLHKNSLRRN